MAANSFNDNMTFLCDKVILDGVTLLPLDPEVNFVFFRVLADTHELQLIYKDSLEADAPERQIILKWEDISGTSISKELNENLITFKFNKSMCGYTVCHFIVNDFVFERLNSAVDVMYFYIMRTRHGMTEAQARKQIRDVYVMEDSDFGQEEDLIAWQAEEAARIAKAAAEASKNAGSAENGEGSSQNLVSENENETENPEPEVEKQDNVNDAKE